MAKLLLAFVIGSLIGLSLPSVLSPYETLVTAIAGVICLAFKRYAITCLCFAVVNCAIVTNSYLSWQVQAVQIKQDFHLVGTIDSQVKVNSSKSTFNLKTELINGQPQQSLLRLSWYQPDMLLQKGDKLTLTVRLKPIHGLKNEYGFDYQKWLISEGIQATGYIKQLQLDYQANTFQTIQQQAFLNLTQRLDTGGTLYALATGDKQAISDTHWQLFVDIGTAHLMAISGLHLGLVFSWSWLLTLLLIKGLWLLASKQRLCKVSFVGFRLLKAKQWAALLALAVAWAYCAYTGFALPTSRACIMLSVFVLAYCTKWHISWFERYLAAMVTVLLVDPFSPLSAGFWLSFSAAGLILLALSLINIYWQGITSWKKWLVQLLAIQVFLSLVLLPIQVMTIGFYPSGSLLANFVAIPWISVLVLPLTLISQLLAFVWITPAELLLNIADYWQSTLVGYLDWIYSLQLPQFRLTSWPIALTLLLGMIALQLPWQRFFRIGLVAVMGLVLIPVTASHQQWQMTVFDVGQGLAVLFERQLNGTKQAVLYDTGAGFRSGFTLYKAVIKPRLKQTASELTTVIISHFDNDHAGGLAELQQDWPNAQLISTRNGLCLADKKYNWLKLNWLVLSPQANAVFTGNNASCVIRVDDGISSVLLTGDIEKQAEMELLPKLTPFDSTDIVLIPHHGSATSSTQAFISATKASHFIISRGRYNRFNHPSPVVLKRVTEFERPIWDTAKQGQVSISFIGEQYSVNSIYSDGYIPWWRGAIEPL